MHRTGNAEARVGAEALDEFGGLGVRLELEGLLRALGEAVGRAAAIIARVDVGAALHEDLDDLVQAAERRAAPLLHRVLREVAAAIVSRPGGIDAALDRGLTALRAGGFAVDYLELRDAADLAAVEQLVAPARLLVAARLGRTRLIDNIPVMPETGSRPGS